MHNIVFAEEVQRYKNLNCEALDQVERESLEIVHLDEFVQVHRQHFECNHQVLAEHELVKASNNIFLIFFVLIIQMFD